MPVTFRVAEHDANPVVFSPRMKGGVQPTADDTLKRICPHEQVKEIGEMLQSSVPQEDLLQNTLRPSKNGFVNAALEAYSNHHHLRIRPDDIWIAILTQLSFYVNKHAEELRKYFVAHEGQKELVVRAVGTRYTVDFGHMARQMSSQIHSHVVDKTLVEWVLPDFTTTTAQDLTICSVQLMSTLKSYFTYTFSLRCGIPSVTLEGEKADWERLYKRLDRLPELGAEPAHWAELLRPILRRFVDAFDGRPDIEFWQRVAHLRHQGSGESQLSGWITAFCVWDSKGRWLAGSSQIGVPEDASAESQSGSVRGRGGRQTACTLDSVRYFQLGIGSVPEGYCDVDVLVDDNGEEFKCKMVSGHVAIAISKSSTDSEDQGVEYDTLSPAPQWFLYVKA